MNDTQNPGRGSCLPGRGRQTLSPYAAYRKTTGCLGATMLVHVALMTISDLLSPWYDLVLCLLFSGRAYVIVEELSYGVSYLLSFMLPVLFYRLISPKDRFRPMALSPTVSRDVVLLIPASLALVRCASIVNDRFVGAFFPSAYTPAAYELENYEGVLLFITSCAVPAFCEEFLFRGLIQNELRPYGKTVSIVGSALLFGLMHENPWQFFYTTVAGIVLGLLCAESGSIWAGVLVHLFNNLSSTVITVLDSRTPLLVANRLIGALEVALTGIGLTCLIVLILRRGRRAKPQEEPAWMEYPWRGFFTPLMICYVAIALFDAAHRILPDLFAI